MLKMDIDLIRELTQDIISGKVDAEKITREDAEKIREKINPLAPVEKQTVKSYANLSIHNWRDHYMRKLHTVSFIGFLFRSLADSNIDDEKKDVRLFLDSLFKYDPEKHIRKSSSKLLSLGGDNGEELVEQQKDDEGDEGEGGEENALSYQAVASSIEAINKAIEHADLDTQGILAKQVAALEEQKQKLYSKCKGYLRRNHNIALVASAKTPAEVFYNYDRYFDNNYEGMKDVVEALYHEKPDIEFSVIYYKSFAELEDAKAHITKNANEFTHDVITVSNEGTTLLGPFKENTSKLEFYNSNTNILKMMMEQQISDNELGKDLLKKRITTEKRKNIEEHGLDAEGLRAYKSNLSVIGELGVKESLSSEERDALNKAIYEKKQAEVPDDAIAVNAFYADIDENGEQKMKTAEFYTKAEEPLHMQKDSKYADKYQ